MNISEANAVNTLLDYLLGQRRHSLRDPPTSAQAMLAAELLAARAHSGWLPSDVRTAWEAAKPPGAERLPAQD